MFTPTLGNNPRIQASNSARECIRRFFPNRKCFVFEWPTHDIELIKQLETISEDQLDPTFKESAMAFASYIFTYAKIKTLREGIKVTGNGEFVVVGGGFCFLFVFFLSSNHTSLESSIC